MKLNNVYKHIVLRNFLSIADRRGQFCAVKRERLFECRSSGQSKKQKACRKKTQIAPCVVDLDLAIKAAGSGDCVDMDFRGFTLLCL